MINEFNDQVASTLMSLEEGDLHYCLKLAKRFEHMGVGSEQAGKALCTLADGDMLEAIYQAS